MKSNAYWNSTDFRNTDPSHLGDDGLLGIFRYRRTLMTLGLILAIAAADLLSGQVVSVSGSNSPAFMEKMKHWQDEMSEKSSESPTERWDRDMLERMSRMHEEMNRVFKDAYQELRTLPEHMEMFDEPRFGSSLVLREEGDEYIIRAYLPDRNLQDLKVDVEGKVLKIEAKAETNVEQKDKGVMSSHKAAYAQTLTLPGPVVSDKMRIDRKDGMVVVTLPKAPEAK